MPLAAPILTPAVISKLPLGLLGFFGIKNGGQYPQSIGNVIQPQLDMSGLLWANYHENVGATMPTLAGTGFRPVTDTSTGTLLVVPQNELWYIVQVSAIVFTGVGDSFTGSLAVRSTQSGTGSFWHRAISPEITAVASQFRILPASRELWLTPGDELGAWITAFVNASGTAQLTWNFERVRFPI